MPRTCWPIWTSRICDLIESGDHWPLFEVSLLPKARWDGMVEELRELRNRNAHCRRPHADDLNRVEQALRDLERGARVALEAHNIRSHFTERMNDPIADGWIRQEHEAASRLIDHCYEQYDTRLRIEWSVRPWAEAPDDDIVAGREGMFVHASFTIGVGYIEPATFWRDYFSYRSSLNKHLVFLVMDDPWSPSFTFSAVDGAANVNDVIGNAFDAIITGHTRVHFGMNELDEQVERWQKSAEGLDARVQVSTALSLAYPDQPFSVFNA